MALELHPPTYRDFVEIASWLPDAGTCRMWAGSDVPYPFLPAELALLLDVERRPSFCLVNQDDPPLGFGQYGMRTSTIVHLSRIIVSPKERWKGLGQLMCKMLLEKAFAETHAVAASLRVYRENEVALAAYKKLGFQPVEDGSDAEVLFMVAEKHFGQALG